MPVAVVQRLIKIPISESNLHILSYLLGLWHVCIPNKFLGDIDAAGSETTVI